MGTESLTYAVWHHTTLRYTDSVALSFNEVRMRPRDRGSQSTLAFSLLTNPAAVPRSRIDYFGNYVHRVDVTTPHDVLEFANVSRPIVVLEEAELALGQLQIRPIEPFAGHLEKMCRQYRDVLLPVAQRRHLDREDAQPVVEILPESSGADCGLQVVVTGRDHAEVGASRFLVANRLELTFLEDAEQLGLHLRRQVTHFARNSEPPSAS